MVERETTPSLGGGAAARVPTLAHEGQPPSRRSPWAGTIRCDPRRCACLPVRTDWTCGAAGPGMWVSAMTSGAKTRQRQTFVGVALAIGAGLGLIIGVITGGGAGVAIGLGMGAGLGVVVGAAWDASHARR